MNGYDHPPVPTIARAQGGPGRQWALRVDDTAARLGEALVQRLAQEHFVPVPVPGDIGAPAEPLQREADAENGHGQQSAPGERSDQRGWGSGAV